MGWSTPSLTVPRMTSSGRFWKRRKFLIDVAGQLESEIGKIPVSGRFHRMPRQVQDDYAISRTVLGTGYSGEVLMATQKSEPGLTVAVKVLQLHKIESSKLEQLKSEVEIFLRMDHPQITRLYDVYESQDTLALVMECMEGGELFDRVRELKRFQEEDASQALRQMLLALNYLHSHGIVHRDIKLENFLYDKKGSKHLKLIDFGFSKMWDPSVKMHASLGTVAYVAPEVLQQSYTSQCDLWSLGVIGFVLLSGYMPFGGTGDPQLRAILAGKFKVKPDRWRDVSPEAGRFVRSLLEVNPQRRLTAKAALEHPFIVRHQAKDTGVDKGVVEALQQFGHTSKFRRCCMEMMAWSLSNEQRAKVCEHFISLNTSCEGTITLSELRQALDTLGVSDEQEVKSVFEALDSNQDHEIHYSDFLAAMLSTKIDLNEELMAATFRKFDTDSSGYITLANLREMLGDTFEGEHVEVLLREAGFDEQGGISYPEFVAFLSRSPASPRSPRVRQASTELSVKCRSFRGERLPSKFKCVLGGLGSIMACRGVLPEGAP